MPLLKPRDLLSSNYSTSEFDPGRFRRAESESEVKNFEILHPDLEITEDHPKIIVFCIRSVGFGVILFLEGGEGDAYRRPCYYYHYYYYHCQ